MVGRAWFSDAAQTSVCKFPWDFFNSLLVGVYWKTIGHIERGSYPIALTTFARLSQFLETSPNRLLEGLTPPDPERTARIKKAMVRKRAVSRKKG